MTTRRSYSDGCAAAHALDLVGERWALLIVRELLLGPKRFSDLRAHLGGISSNVLTQRLNELEAASVLWRRKLPPPASVWAYELTDWGRELEPILLGLVRWGVRSAAFQRGAPIGADALILSFKSLADRDALQSADFDVNITLGAQEFHARAHGGMLHVGRGRHADARVHLTTDTATLLRLAYAKANLDEAVAAQTLRLTGDRAVLQTFLDVLHVPAVSSTPDLEAETG